MGVLLFSCGDVGQRAEPLEELDAWGAEREVVPTDAELLDELVAALDLRMRDEQARLLDAREPGELREEAMLTQDAIDRGVFGLDALFAVGDELFDLTLRPEWGLGNGIGGAPPNLRRVHEGSFGGPDALSCASCHSLGGLDGAGAASQIAFFRGDGDSTSAADARSPPHLLGLGPIEALAREMTLELQAIRAQAITTGEDLPLETHGVSFGTTDNIEGIDRDLVVRPFGWKGHAATIREIAEEAFRVHLGIVSSSVQARIARGELDPAIYGDGPPDDVDRDGVRTELDDGMLTTMVAYLAQLETPEIIPPTDEVMLEHFARGSAVFEEIGCARCHVPRMILADPILETRPDHPDLADRAPIRIDVARDGEAPRIEPIDSRGTRFYVRLFSDLRRHDMGPELASPSAQGPIPASDFLTRPLWGLAETAPYLHDGRAATIEDAILFHGGEAEDARDAYAAMEQADRVALRVFLTSLSRTPRVRVP